MESCGQCTRKGYLGRIVREEPFVAKTIGGGREWTARSSLSFFVTRSRNWEIEPYSVADYCQSKFKYDKLGNIIYVCGHLFVTFIMIER